MVATRRLKGGLSTNTRAVTVARPDGTTRKAVLRTFVDLGWITAEPDLAAREAALLEVLERAGVPAPRLLGVDADGEASGSISLLMTLEPGRPVNDPADRRPWIAGLVEALGQVHAVAPPPIPNLRDQAGRIELHGGEARPRRYGMSVDEELWAHVVRHWPTRGAPGTDAAARRLPPGQRAVVPRPAHEHRRLDRRRLWSAGVRRLLPPPGRVPGVGPRGGRRGAGGLRGGQRRTGTRSTVLGPARCHAAPRERRTGGGGATSTSASLSRWPRCGPASISSSPEPSPTWADARCDTRWSEPPSGGYRHRHPAGVAQRLEPQPSKLVVRVRFPSPAPALHETPAARIRRSVAEAHWEPGSHGSRADRNLSAGSTLNQLVVLARRDSQRHAATAATQRGRSSSGRCRGSTRRSGRSPGGRARVTWTPRRSDQAERRCTVTDPRDAARYLTCTRTNPDSSYATRSNGACSRAREQHEEALLREVRCEPSRPEVPLVLRVVYERHRLTVRTGCDGEAGPRNLAVGPRSSDGQSRSLLMTRSQVRVLPRAQRVAVPSRGRPMLNAPVVAVAQVVRAPGCGPGGRGFKSPRSPQARLVCHRPEGFVAGRTSA